MGAPVTTVLPPGSTPDSDTFQIASMPPNVGFLKRGVQPPSDVYIEVADLLVVGAASSQPNEVLTVSYRILRYDGVLIHGQFTLNVPANRSIVTHSEPLAEGFLLSMSCKAAVSTTRGGTFVRAFLTKPSLGPGQPSYMLMADYVTTAMAPAHPNGRVLTPVEGPGRVYAFLGTAPAAGADWSIAVPTNARWKVLSAKVTLVTDAVVGNRIADMQVISSGLGVYFGGSGQVQTASQTRTYTWANGQGSFFDGVLGVMEPLPVDLRIGPNANFGTFTNALDAADQWGAPVALVEEWLDNV